ncbi:MAG: DUF4349 domain-containing protein [Acidobacteriia bacterium]|nr:DUF4349 domain-containing protein [Terriglobia bacterium]
MRTRNHPVEPEELMAYLDGELPHDRAAEAAAHLERCAECQTLAADLREVSRRLTAWQVETPEGASSDDIFAALKDEERDRPPATKAGIHHWWNVILSHRMLWAGGMVSVMALTTVFFVSSVQRARSNRSVMEGYANPPAGNVSGYTAPVVPAVPSAAAQAPAVRQRVASRSSKTTATYEYSYDSTGKLASPGTQSETSNSKSAQEFSETDLNLSATSVARDGLVGKNILDKNGALNDLKREPPANQTVEVTAAAATVETSPADSTAVNANGGAFSANGLRGRNNDLSETKAKTEKARAQAAPANQPRPPMIVHEAQLSLVSRDFDQGRAAIDEILKRHGGYVGSLNVSAPPGSGRTLNGTLRVPAVQLQETLAELKKLGRVTYESQSGDEITEQYVDLEARLANSRNSEQRLKELQRDRTGKLKDVMEVELQIGRVREEIETMDAERKNLGNRVDFATLTITLAEEYKAELQVVPVSTWTRMGNAAVEGYRTMVEGIVGVLLYLLSVLPSLLLLSAILFFPARWSWKRIKLQRAAV